MKYISHRGNISGKIPERENSPDYIQEALDQGFDVEIDVRYTKNGWFLGHDAPQYKINKDFLETKGLWVHSKTVETFAILLASYDINTFFHDKDDVILTSRGWLWTYPGKHLTTYYSVAVMPELAENWKAYDLSKAKAICSDYIENYKKDINFHPSK